MRRLNITLPETGSVIVSILVVMFFLITITSALVVLATSNLSRARGRIFTLQSQYAAESAADAAIAMLNSGNDTYTGTSSAVTLLTNTIYKSTYTVSVAGGSNVKEKIITATGNVYVPASASTPRYIRRIEVVAQRSSTETTSGVVSRNIIEVQSGVKNLTGRDVYVNGYINMNKNTTTLTVENVTAGGKNTGASNCSIGVSGNLSKPSSFHTSGQTKTQLILAYNNCINPPGNTSNTNFNVYPNQTNISKIQSTYIPWSQFMDSSYQSAGTCADWTTGTSPRAIPSSGNTKKTHYPDNGTNISTTCGSGGDLALGSNQYNITDNVHIRANLCAASACSPTFYNPNSGASGIKYVFVEGTINFNSLQTASGSGPIVFISYGTDPSSKTGSCPYGGAIYLGSSGNTAAPAAYFIANNGICLDKTKFGSSPALGGLSGKNLYIATSPGTPFDLALDPNFPVSTIPVDLAWHAARYRRL